MTNKQLWNVNNYRAHRGLFISRSMLVKYSIIFIFSLHVIIETPLNESHNLGTKLHFMQTE